MEGAAQQKLDLRVEAAQFGIGPTLEGFVRRRVQPKQECFPLRHGPLLVERARVDDGLRIAVAAQHHKQVAHHTGLSLFVEIDDVLRA